MFKEIGKVALTKHEVPSRTQLLAASSGFGFLLVGSDIGLYLGQGMSGSALHYCRSSTLPR